MVSIRRPNQRRKKSSDSIRNGVLVMIALMLVFHVLRKEPSTDKLQDELHHQRENRLRGQPPKVDKIPEHHAQQHRHHDHDVTDADDHVEKPAEAVKEAAPEKKPPAAEQHLDQDEHEPVVEKKEEPKVQEPEKPAAPLDPAASQVLAKHGTGPTTLGYVVDMVDQRNNPVFRKAELNDIYSTLEQKVAQLAGESGMKACEYIKDRKLHYRADCKEKPLVAYNGASFPRTICGQNVAPGAIAKLSESSCADDVVRLFAVSDPPLSGENMPSIVIQKEPGSIPVDKESLEHVSCDIPCEFEKGIETESTRHVGGTDWELYYSDANPYYKEEAKIERLDYRKDRYYSTTSLSASVPLSFYSFDKYSLRNRPPIEWETADNSASYFVNGDCNAYRRNKWLDALSATGFSIKSYGSCGHTTDLGEGESISTEEGRIALAKKSRIHLAWEDGDEKDHITTVIWESLLSGAVPAILGTRNAEELLPPNSAIFASRFNSWDKFAAHIKEVSENRTLWESYHKWRTDEKAIADFEMRFNFTKTSSQCRTCRWAYAKRYGLGWEHMEQVVREPRIRRQLCFDQTNHLVTKPFREVWVHGDVPPPNVGSESCASNTDGETNVDRDGYKVDRLVRQHDGVVDMSIKSLSRESTDEEVVLRLEFGVKNAEGAYFPNTHTLVSTVRGPLVTSASIQDSKAKVTVLANWDTIIRSPLEGVIEVVVQKKDEPIDSDEGRKLRVITEDVSLLHDKLTEFFPTSFSKQMIEDFVDPIELFYTEPVKAVQ